MVRRRWLLLTSSALPGTILAPSQAQAALPAILAAIAAITALTVATAGAAEAVQKLLEKGMSIWNTASSLQAQREASRAFSEQQREIAEKLRMRRELIAGGDQAQQRNAMFVGRMNFYLITRNSDDWAVVVPAMQQAGQSLAGMAFLFRKQAVFFPAEAQDALRKLPELYESRVSIIRHLQDLSTASPPSSDEEVSKWKELMSGYDGLRVESLKLLKALDVYTAPRQGPSVAPR
ncbi:hypothetical protein [Roseomonas sp. 18066]|uniref:hypothetical protein n=1 Tax=Roseomonas sp. 18066 TaxID=2681412 RepID=UPI001358D314|nr:hypothetical protein [Roseomonas sp. 18066]